MSRLPTNCILPEWIQEHGSCKGCPLRRSCSFEQVKEQAFVTMNVVPKRRKGPTLDVTREVEEYIISRIIKEGYQTWWTKHARELYMECHYRDERKCIYDKYDQAKVMIESLNPLLSQKINEMMSTDELAVYHTIVTQFMEVNREWRKYIISYMEVRFT